MEQVLMHLDRAEDIITQVSDLNEWWHSIKGHLLRWSWPLVAPLALGIPESQSLSLKSSNLIHFLSFRVCQASNDHADGTLHRNLFYQGPSIGLWGRCLTAVLQHKAARVIIASFTNSS